MTLLELRRSALPLDSLTQLRSAVAGATEPDRLEGRYPYHYTFWYPLSTTPSNLIETAVQDHLIHHIPAGVRAAAAGVEWWLGRLDPPYATNFEFGLHHDIGENPETGALESPMLSTVLYLTDVDDGPLLVFDGVPDPAAENQEHVFPAANLYAMFPGHLWHSVASRREVGAGEPAVPERRLRLTVLVNWWPYRPSDLAVEPMKQVAADYDGSMYPELTAPASVVVPIASS